LQISRDYFSIADHGAKSGVALQLTSAGPKRPFAVEQALIGDHRRS